MGLLSISDRPAASPAVPREPARRFCARDPEGMVEMARGPIDPNHLVYLGTDAPAGRRRKGLLG